MDIHEKMVVAGTVCDELARTYEKSGRDSAKEGVGGSHQISKGYSVNGGGTAGFAHHIGERKGRIVTRGGKRKFVGDKMPHPINGRQSVTKEEKAKINDMVSDYLAKGGKINRV